MLRNKLTIGILCLLFLCGCDPATVNETTATKPAPVQLSAEGIDAAEPVTATASDGSVYVAWVNHDVKNQADVMIGHYAQGKMRGTPVRVNPQAGTATAWRGDQPSVAVGQNGSVYVVWTARVEVEDKKGTDLYLSVSNDMPVTNAVSNKANKATNRVLFRGFIFVLLCKNNWGVGRQRTHQHIRCEKTGEVMQPCRRSLDQENTTTKVGRTSIG